MHLWRHRLQYANFTLKKLPYLLNHLSDLDQIKTNGKLKASRRCLSLFRGQSMHSWRHSYNMQISIWKKIVISRELLVWFGPNKNQRKAYSAHRLFGMVSVHFKKSSCYRVLYPYNTIQLYMEYLTWDYITVKHQRRQDFCTSKLLLSCSNVIGITMI